MEARSQFFDRLVLAVGPGAVRQQRNRELALRIDPQGRAGKTQVAVRPRIKILAGLRRLRRSVPTESARSSHGRFLPAGEEVNCFCLEHRCAAAQQAMCELGEIAGSREHSSMTGDSAHYESVLIMHLALDHAIADLLTVRSRNDLPLHLFGGIEETGVHP